MLQIQNFSDAFEYVNSRYIYNAENYPAMKHLTETEAKIFALKHGLLHLLKSVHKIRMKIPFEKQHTSVWERDLFSRPNENMSTSGVEFRQAMLKTIVNILSICNTAEFSKKDCEEYINIKLSGEDMTLLIPIEQLNKNNPVIPTFVDTVNYFINKLTVILEEADHKNTIDGLDIWDISKNVFMSMNYWFDDSWTPDFLNQIPDVMKSK
ncbi:MAG: hypothetical protein NTX85_03700 [Candidatus Nomurabacteria bacterium]|nr:hypothetical protein [Candidatus Nomurabacteria bacterium]